jgi:8-oxo-dGTP diphosphatase
MMDDIRFATKGVVFKDDKVLVLIRSKKDRFRPGEKDFPGGKIEFGEEPDKGLLREVKEESGLDVKLIGPARCWSAMDKPMGCQVVGASYLCEWKKGDVKLSEEHSSFHWVTAEKLMRSKCRQWMKSDLKAALRLRKNNRKH